MQHYGIDVSAERRSTLPVWDIEYESKFIYSEAADTLYYGSDTGWVTVSGGGGGGGVSSHSALTELDYASANHTGFSPTVHSHTESNISDLDKYTQAEVDGLITTISGKLDDHDELNNLDYASAGHTGFAPTSHSHTESDVSDLDKYTQAEINTISGSLSSEIDSDISTHTSDSDVHHNESHNVASHSDTTATGANLNTLVGGGDTTLHKHDGQYYTESEVDNLITTISGKLDDHNELNNLDYASAGHTGFSPTVHSHTDKMDKIASTDNEVTRFDGTDGDVQGYTSSPPTITDDGLADFPGGLKTSDPIDEHGVGDRGYNDSRYTLKASNVTTVTNPASNAAVTTTIIDAYSGVVITLNLPGNVQTLQSPTDATAGKRFTIVADDGNDAHTIVVNTINMSAQPNSFTLSAGEAIRFIWDGSAWVVVGVVDADDIIANAHGDIVATDVQAYLDELEDEKVKRITSVDNEITRFDSTGGDIQGYTSNAPTIDDDGLADFPGGLASKINEIIQASSDTLTVAELSGVLISNYGQGAANNLQTFPTAAKGMSCVCSWDSASG
jgi:plastocyanin